MRYINIDLSSDNHLQQLQIFGGYAGEHNETVLQVTLPQRMIGIEYSDYRFDFQTSEDNEIPVPVSKLINGVLSCHLTEQLTVAGKLLFNVVARKLDGKVVSLTSKTNMVNLYIGDSPDGNSVLPDPNGYKDEILKMVDLRIAEINPAQVDQTYNPESENAQSGKAVAGAVGTWEKIVDITTSEEVNSIVAAVEEFPKIAKCKEFVVRVIFPIVEADISLGTSYIYINKGACYQTTATKILSQFIAEIRASVSIIDGLIQSFTTSQPSGQASVKTGAYMIIGPRFVTEDINEIKYVLSNSEAVLPTGVQFIVYGKVEG